MALSYAQVEKAFNDAIEDIDIPDTYYEKAITSYDSVTQFLTRDDSEIVQYDPAILLQGSMKIGTAIKPVSQDGSYDVDIVCNLRKLGKDKIAPASLKKLVGDEVCKYGKAHAMQNEPHEGSRCWTLEYVDEANFHIDILSSLTDTISYRSFLAAKNIPYDDDSDFLAFSDKKHPSYNHISNDWPITNPTGYADWFISVSRFEEKRSKIAKAHNVSIEEIKIYQAKTDLQRFVQILKRHRDVFFEGESEHRVSSVVITTLTGLAYNDSQYKSNRIMCFKDVVSRLDNYIKKEERKFELCNPANRAENFIEKWETDDHFTKSFQKWLQAVNSDLAFFGTDFKLYNERALNSFYDSLSLTHPDSGMVKTEGYKAIASLPHHQNPKWPIREVVPVKIAASKRMERGFARYKNFSSGDQVPKAAQLKFEAVADNLKRFTVYWQITNTGNEANAANCLRGDFYSGEIEEGRRIRKEETLYTGSHVVECYLIADEICYAKSEPFIVNVNPNSVLSVGW